MRDRTAWTRCAPGSQKIRGKKYKNLIEFTRPCQACNKPFSIFVTQRIADGEADTNNFGLRNCEEHRRSPRPPSMDENEMEALRSRIRVMGDELTGLYALNKELTIEVEALRGGKPALVGGNKMPWEAG